MESSTGFFAVWSPRLLSLLRIVAGAGGGPWSLDAYVRRSA
jgi:hypothetical protein